jgi:hypothetical protein
MPTIWGDFHVGGIPRDGATVKLWSAGAFSSSPVKDDAIPSGSPLASTTTGPAHGANGAYRFDALASGSYYASIEWNGAVIYQQHRIDDATGRGETLASNYANLQAAINATPSGGTLYIPQGTYTISGSAYAWTDVSGGTHTGLLVQDRPINIVGAGTKTILRAGAANVEVLTILSTSGASSTRTSRCTYEHFTVDNANAFTGCTGLRLDRARRNRFRGLKIGDDTVTSGGFANGVKLFSAYINDFYGCYFHQNDVAINANTSYGGAQGGASHAIMLQGGEIASNGVGIQASGSHECHIHSTVIEGNTSGVILDNCTQWTLHGIYWESTGSNYDLMLKGNWRNVYVDNTDRIYARDGYNLTVGSFPGGVANRFDHDDTVGNVVFQNWWVPVTVDNTDERSDILNGFERNRLRIQNTGESMTKWVVPDVMYGENLLQNGEMADAANGWTLSNMASDSNPPFLTRYTVATNTTVASTVCSATKAIQSTFSGMITGHTATLGCWVNIPDTTWGATIRLVDADRSQLFTIPNFYKNGKWHPINFNVRIGDAATTLQWQVRYTVGSSASGVAYAAGAYLRLGQGASWPISSPDILPPRNTFPKQRIKTVRSLDSTSQIDPFACGIQIVQGNGGAVAMATGQALFSGTAEDGMEVELWGNSASSTLTLTEGGSSNIDLGAATRVLGLRSVIRLRYSSTMGIWNETYYRS